MQSAFASILIKWKASRTVVMFVCFFYSNVKTIHLLRPLLQLRRLAPIPRNSILEHMFLALMHSLLSSVLWLLRLLRSRQTGHAKSMERATFFRIRSTFQLTVFVSVPGHQLWYLLISFALT